ncbi:MAG: hypothetical protein ABEJ95_03425 [Candidatus Nanohalobium sp.]
MPELEDRVENLENRVRELESRLDAGAEAKAESLKEFVKQVDPEGHDEVALAIGYYLENIEGSQGFTASDIKEGYKRAKRQPYSNISVLLGRMKDNGDIMVFNSGSTKNTYTLTLEGEEKIEEVQEDE